MQGSGISSTIFRIKTFTGDPITTSSDRRDLSSTERAFEFIQCGSEHSYALSTEGDLFSWGLNFKGQLGLGDFENRNEPTLVESLSPIDSTSA